jgi:peptidoglycan/xylan/chitin deacetylase (PgdA/CDA1 family)
VMLGVSARRLVAQVTSQMHWPCFNTSHGVRSLIALNYHYFTEGTSTSYLEVNRDVVDSQFRALRQNFSFSPAKQALQSVFRGDEGSDRPEIIITIDDGCVSFEIIRPLIERYEIPVVLFIPVGLCLETDDSDGLRSRCLRLYQEIDRSQDELPLLNPAEFFQMLMAADHAHLRALEERFRRLPCKFDAISTRKLFSMAELRSLAKHPLITLAPHSMSHQALGRLPSQWIEWEVAKSCEQVAALGGDTELFAYPYGDPRSVDDRCARALANCGSKFAFTTLCYRISKTCNQLLLGRSPVFNYPGGHYILGTAAGALEWYDIARHGKKLYDTRTRLPEGSQMGGAQWG